ncbi:hypothetical protein TNCV_2936331 [Trichonephila clavipes]|nr:hypothetical protein TNCV_2936331 [Trichonephila clavipes]
MSSVLASLKSWMTVTFSVSSMSATRHLYGVVHPWDEFAVLPLSSNLCEVRLRSCPHAWLFEHLMPSHQIPTDYIVSQEFIKSSALKQVVAIHSGTAAEWTGLVSSQASGCILPKSHARWLGESGNQPWLSLGASGLGSQWSEFPMASQGACSFGSL